MTNAANASKRIVTNASNENEKFKGSFRKCVCKKCSNSFFLCGVLSCNSPATFKKFRWPIKIVKLRKRQKKFKKFENNQILNCKLYLKNYLFLQSKKTENYFVATRNSAKRY